MNPLLQSAIDSLWGPGAPYGFQRESAEFLLRAGYGISADEMGLGKTLEGILVMLAGFSEGPSKALVVCPNSLKINWVRELETWAPHLRVVWAREGKKLPTSFGEYDVAVINYEQFKYAAGLFSEAQTVVADECFPTGTLVDTPQGPVPIEDLSPGDEILNCSGIDTVVATNASRSSDIVVINDSIKCTSGHPFFTQRGWVTAANLRQGDILIGTHYSMRILREGSSKGIKQGAVLRDILLCEMEDVYTGNGSKGVREIQTEKHREEERSLCRRKDTSFQAGEEKSEILRVAQGEQLHAEERFSGEDVSDFADDRTQAQDPWRKREGAYKARGDGFIPPGGGVGLQPCCAAGETPLQSGCCQSTSDGGNRDRWALPQFSCQEGAGREEGSPFEGIRVESIEAEKSGGRVVHNLQIRRHPSFSISGVLVHNCHYLCNMWSGRTNLFHHHIERCKPRRLAMLTGTPIKNRTQELYSLLVLCSMLPSGGNGGDIRREFPSVLPFMEKFCHKRPIFERGRPGFEYYGLKNREELDRLLDGKVIRHAEKDCHDLPPTTRTVREVELPDVDSIFDAELKTAWEDFQASRRTQFLAAKKAACAVYKVPATVERVEALLSAGAGPVVVFSDHVDSAKLLAATLEKKYRVGLVHGEVDLRFRQAWVDGFQTGKLDALVATIPALKEGVTLTRGNRLVYNDLPWEPASLEQSAKRIHRIGQTRPCFVDIIALTGMDAMIARTLARKMSVIDKILSPLEQESRNAKPRNFTARS